MANPCEVLVETGDHDEAFRVVERVEAEARRIEAKFSRYLENNLVHRINTAAGRAVDIDEETARLLDFADELYRLSDGKFDVTSGVLGRAWRFDGSGRVPSPNKIDALRKRVGWDRVQWDGSRLRMEPGMQLDFGGLGKEYAVDRAAALAEDEAGRSALVNFGGDLAVVRPREDLTPWRVGTEGEPGNPDHASTDWTVRTGALATSGDTRRDLLKDGVRYGHILDPKTGYPVEGAPRSVTVLAGACTQAGMLATLAMLKGPSAAAFLEDQEVEYRVRR